MEFFFWFFRHYKREGNVRKNREIPLNFDTHRDLIKTKELAEERNKDLKKVCNKKVF